MSVLFERENGVGGVFLQDNYRPQNELLEESLREEVIIVYHTENKELFLDEGTLAKLLGLTKINDYVGRDGSSYSASDSVVVDKGVPDGVKKVGEHYSGLDSFPYDYILGLYRVTDYQLADLMRRYEERNKVKLGAEYREVDYKKLNKNNKIDDLNHVRDELKEMFQEENIKNDELADMFKENNNDNKDYDDSKINIK